MLFLLENMRITNIRYGRMLLFPAVILIVITFLLMQFNFHASGGKGIFVQAKEHFHHWFQKAVFKHNWEDIHCRKRHANETVVEESWVLELSKQLNLDAVGTSIFDSNTGCNDWLSVITKKYPSIKIGGAHVDQYAVDYAKRLFNKTPSTFGTIDPDGRLSFLPDDKKFNHAINYGGLKDLGDKKIQCNLVIDLLRILKPGGSLYLGHNIEENECHVLDKYSHVALPGCYWSELCLKNRTDIAEIYYIKEKDLFGEQSRIDDCYTAVFIHKKVVLSRSRGGNDGHRPKYTPHKKMYYCTTKEARNGKFPSAIKEVLGLRVFPGQMYQGFKLAKKLHNSVVNISHT